MVMVSARLTRRWRLSLDERGHRRPARRLVAVRRAAYVAVVPSFSIEASGGLPPQCCAGTRFYVFMSGQHGAF